MISPLYRMFTILILIGAVTPEGWSDTGEQDRDPDWIAPQQSLSERLFLAESQLPDQARKMAVIKEISDRFQKGELAPNDRPAIQLLKTLAEEGVRTEVRNVPAGTRDFPEVRRAAVELLGRIGSPEAEEILYALVYYEQEPLVLSEAVYALGRKKNTLTEEFIRALTYVFAHQVLRRYDNNLAYVCLNMLKKPPGTLNPGETSELFSYILKVPELPFNQEVKKTAGEVIQLWIR